MFAGGYEITAGIDDDMEKSHENSEGDLCGDNLIIVTSR
jgi:hypothetical protein